MGYDLYITRALSWAENTGSEITVDEWLIVVDSDPELTLAGEYGPYFTLWQGTATYEQPWFDWYGGNIISTHPDEPMIKKMIQLAGHVGATVQGDEGEHYQLTERGLAVQSVDADGRPCGALKVLRPWWKRWFSS